MATSYRHTLQSNNKKTKIVIALFLTIYFFIGLILDISLLNNFKNELFYTDIIQNLITFKNTPYITLSMLFLGLVSVFLTLKFNDKMSLWGQDYQLIDNNNKLTQEEKQIYNIVEELKIAANLNYMPKIYIIDADYPNAFASGFSEKSAMVAITRGLLNKLNRAEVQAVLAHEVSHIKHLDIKLTLLVGVLSNIMLMVVDLFFRPQFFKDSKNNNFMIIVLILRFVLPIITSFLIMFLSRTREYMADAGAVKLTRDPEALASALEKISSDYGEHKYIEKGDYIRNSAYIYPPIKKGIAFFEEMFSTHPPIDKRIDILRDKKQRYINVLKMNYDD